MTELAVYGLDSAELRELLWIRSVDVRQYLEDPTVLEIDAMILSTPIIPEKRNAETIETVVETITIKYLKVLSILKNMNLVHFEFPELRIVGDSLATFADDNYLENIRGEVRFSLRRKFGA